MSKRAAVIGAGFGGLALAIRLQSAGIATTVIEARDKPGGRAYVWERDGFTFDAGPTVITDPPCLKELWALSGHDISEDVELMPVMPFYRLNWTHRCHRHRGHRHRRHCHVGRQRWHRDDHKHGHVRRWHF